MRRAAFLLCAGAVCVWGPSAYAAAAPDYASVRQGAYQADLGDCMGCHTAPGGKPFAGGLVLETPFGKLAVPNITPDRDTGIGGWTRDQFRRAVKSGIAPGAPGKAGRRLYPAMPYPSYARMGDGDVDALFAYLQTVAPVHNQVRVNLLPFPFNIRGLMAGWNWIFFKPSAPAPGKSALLDRGEYLVNGPGHCGACHTPKNLFGADKKAGLTGASLEGWFAPAITSQARRGLGGWRAGEIAAYLKNGHNNHAMASGPMAEVIENSTSRMRGADLAAIAAYLKSLPGGNSPVAALPPGDPRMTAGAAVYENNCRACHNENGRSPPALFPPLAANPQVQQRSAQSLVRIVLAGARAAQTPGAPTGPAMPSLAWRLNDAQVADVLTFIRNSWGNAAAPVSPAVVREARKNLQPG